MAPTDVCIIRNLSAGKGRCRRRWEKTRRLLDASGVKYEVRDSARPGHARQLGRTAAEQGWPLVVAAGGDGTLSQVADGLVGSKSALAILPLGTGNDFARHMDLNSVPKCIDAIRDGKSIHVDIATAICTGALPIHMLNIAGIGFDAAVAQRVNRGFGFAKGRSAYLAAVFSCLRTYSAQKLCVSGGDFVFDEAAMLCAVANASSYGGGMRIAPNAVVDDGFLNVVAVGKVSKFQFLRTFPSVFAGAHLQHPAVTSWLCRQVTLESSPPAPVLVDGEIWGRTPATIHMVPRGLLLRVPR